MQDMNDSSSVVLASPFFFPLVVSFRHHLPLPHLGSNTFSHPHPALGLFSPAQTPSASSDFHSGPCSSCRTPLLPHLLRTRGCAEPSLTFLLLQRRMALVVAAAAEELSGRPPLLLATPPSPQEGATSNPPAR